MATKKAPRRRQVKRVAHRTLNRFVEVVGLDGARVMFDAIQAGEGMPGAMQALRSYIARYVAANGDFRGRCQDFYKRLDRGEV